jgi:hypothetical protein
MSDRRHLISSAHFRRSGTFASLSTGTKRAAGRPRTVITTSSPSRALTNSSLIFALDSRTLTNIRTTVVSFQEVSTETRRPAIQSRKMHLPSGLSREACVCGSAGRSVIGSFLRAKRKTAGEWKTVLSRSGPKKGGELGCDRPNASSLPTASTHVPERLSELLAEPVGERELPFFDCARSR